MVTLRWAGKVAESFSTTMRSLITNINARLSVVVLLGELDGHVDISRQSVKLVQLIAL